MKTLAVIAACFYDSARPASRLIETCQEDRLALRLYGIGEKFISFRQAKLDRLADELRRGPAEYVVYTDAADAWSVNASAKRIVDVVDAMGPPFVVMSAERSCWPHGELSHRFIGGHGPYRFPNAGQFAGRCAAVLEMIEAVRAVDSDWNDQGTWLKAIASGVVRPHLDCGATIFQTTDGESVGGSLCFNEGSVVNSLGSKPMFLHFNGGDKERRMNEAWEAQHARRVS